MFGDFSIQETNRLYKEIAQTKEELKNAKKHRRCFFH